MKMLLALGQFVCPSRDLVVGGSCALPAICNSVLSRYRSAGLQLSKKVINLDELRMLAARAVPDAVGVRSTVWKLILGYLPNDRSLWEQELAKKRSQYTAFQDEFLSNPVKIARQGGKEGHYHDNTEHVDNGLLHRSEVTQEEHPLSLGKTSVWNQFF